MKFLIPALVGAGVGLAFPFLFNFLLRTPITEENIKSRAFFQAALAGAAAAVVVKQFVKR